MSRNENSLGDYDWYCDDCDAYLNDQEGFYPECEIWICTECGCENYIDEDSIIDDEELDAYEKSGAISYNDYKEIK